MIAFALALDHLAQPDLLAQVEAGRWPSLWATLSLGYVAVGAAMAWHLARRGHGLGTATSALACWPLLLGLVGRPAPSGAELDLDAPWPRAKPGGEAGGPYGARIDSCLGSLREALNDEALRGGEDLLGPAQIGKLAEVLHRADLRIARVDRLIAETRRQGEWGQDGGLEQAVAGLVRARDHSRRELEAVLSGLLQLRIQLGLFALAGDAGPVRERLGELEARVAALAELSSMDLGQVPA